MTFTARIVWPEPVPCSACGAQMMGRPGQPNACSADCQRLLRWRNKLAKVRRKQEAQGKKEGPA